MYNDWKAVVCNLRRTVQKWAWITWVLSREVADTQTLGQIYLEVAQSVLLYRSYTWILTPCMQRVLGGFYHRLSRRLTGQKPQKQPRKVQEGGWVYPSLEDVMAEAGLQEVKT